MKLNLARLAARPLRLTLLLLGATSFALLGWCSPRVARDHLPVRERTAPLMRSRSILAESKAPVPEPHAGKTGADSLPHELSMPVFGVDPGSVTDTFGERRSGNRTHEALDILAPRGTPVFAVDDGIVKKLFTSVPGGLTVYQFDREEQYSYYYAHLDGYAPELHEGQRLRRGDLVGYVGTTGNAPRNSPHLHFAVIRLDPDKKWWTGTPINPYPLLVKAY